MEFNLRRSVNDDYMGDNLMYNVQKRFAEFYRLPSMERSEAEAILAELQVDMESSWTPSKLVAELDKHIVSQHKAKRTIAQAVRNKQRMRRVD
jgi:ATP-dependent protease Clp ATPase subunit